jgi:hypothetical protein
MAATPAKPDAAGGASTELSSSLLSAAANASTGALRLLKPPSLSLSGSTATGAADVKSGTASEWSESANEAAAFPFFFPFFLVFLASLRPASKDVVGAIEPASCAEWATKRPLRLPQKLDEHEFCQRGNQDVIAAGKKLATG